MSAPLAILDAQPVWRKRGRAKKGAGAARVMAAAMMANCAEGHPKLVAHRPDSIFLFSAACLPTPCTPPPLQDHDGSHIKGLIMNYFHHFYPSLLKLPGFLVEFITPIIKARAPEVACTTGSPAAAGPACSSGRETTCVKPAATKPPAG